VSHRTSGIAGAYHRFARWDLLDAAVMKMRVDLTAVFAT
jgi:hypothetical protein